MGYMGYMEGGGREIRNPDFDRMNRMIRIVNGRTRSKRRGFLAPNRTKSNLIGLNQTKSDRSWQGGWSCRLPIDDTVPTCRDQPALRSGSAPSNESNLIQVNPAKSHLLGPNQTQFGRHLWKTGLADRQSPIQSRHVGPAWATIGMRRSGEVRQIKANPT